MILEGAGFFCIKKNTVKVFNTTAQKNIYNATGITYHAILYAHTGDCPLLG